MKNEQLILTNEDYIFLRECYSSGQISAFNKARLAVELENAKVVKSEYIPCNVVSSNANVLVFNLDKIQTFSVRIISNGLINRRKSELSISDPLAIALLGYPAGAITEWEMHDGINRFQVISVYQAAIEQLINPVIW